MFSWGRHAPLAQGDPGQPPPLKGSCEAETCTEPQPNGSLCVRPDMPRDAALGGRGRGRVQLCVWGFYSFVSTGESTSGPLLGTLGNHGSWWAVCTCTCPMLQPLQPWEGCPGQPIVGSVVCLQR